jgi:hypothetical protein
MPDSSKDTLEHKAKVEKFIDDIAQILIIRGMKHDDSKLQEPEKSKFDIITQNLAGSEYGSKNYFNAIKDDAIKHHYQFNSHHPEHYPDGIIGMDIIDIVEMLCDWKAASMRHNTGDIKKSIEINQERFGYSNDLKQIFLNSLKYFNQE